MNECYDCRNWEEKYDKLYYRFNRLSNSYSDLEKRYNDTYNKLDSANFKIRDELEPRIKSEQRSYDAYVTSGGGDECFHNGMNSHCGFECSIFGDKQECFEGITTEEQILDIYENYVDTGYILTLIEKYGLEEKAKEIDREVVREQIKIQKEKIERLEQELLEI